MKYLKLLINNAALVHDICDHKYNNGECQEDKLKSFFECIAENLTNNK